MSQKSLVQSQFGTHAANYVASRSHATGASLARMIELLQPRKDWRVLDVATGAGHMALMLAPLVHEAIASDLTPQMLEQTRKLAVDRGITNLAVEQAEAESLPFGDARFDLVTCRLAAHHFDDVIRFVSEVFRVLKPGGVFGLVDNVSPEGAANAAYNAFEKLRDPSHGYCLTLNAWKSAITQQGFQVMHFETIEKPMDFEAWTDQMSVTAPVKAELRAMFSAPALAAYLKPNVDATEFVLTEGLVVADKPK